MKKQLCLLFTFSSLLASCGGGNSKPPTTFSTKAILSEERTLTNDERKIATRICYAYQSKSNSFRSGGLIGQTFTFSAKKTDCQGTLMTYNVGAVLHYDNNNNLLFAPPVLLDPNLRFYQNVQTDTNGYLSQLCTKIKANEEINNTTVVNNTKVQISFGIEGLDYFLLMYFNKQANGTYKIDSAEKFKVRTQTNLSTGQLLGMDEEYSTQKVCSSFDKVPNSNFVQKFISR
jgi:hypothetical protein